MAPIPTSRLPLLRRLAAAALGAAFALAAAQTAQAIGPRGVWTHAITLYGDAPKYGPGFPHWDYVNPEAPKGGDLVLSAFGSYDSLNPFIVRGTPAAGVSLIYESLVEGNADEATTMYGYLADSMMVADDLSSITFKMRPEARWHDGKPVTAHDVVFSYGLLREQGRPLYRSRFAEIEKVEALDDHTVRIGFSSAQNRQALLSAGALSILPKHYWEGRKFDETTLEPPPGSGPYRIASVDPGRSITFERVEDWWGKDLPHNKGRYNFDRIRYDYYRDANVLFEAFRSGQYDAMMSISSQDWATAFDTMPQVKDGRIVKEQIPSTDPDGFFGFWFNLRRPAFEDARVREAIAQLYDFETARRTVHYGLFRRTESYFPNTELAATGLPEGEEKAILERFRGRIPEKMLTEPFKLPKTDGSGNIRDNLRRATRLLQEAGYEVRNGVMTDAKTGRPLEFQILYYQSNLEKVVMPFVRNLERAGIRARPRLVDTSQYTQMLDSYDFDMTLLGLNAFYPPGPELRDLWNSKSADIPGNENFTGVKHPVLDELVELVVSAESLDSLRQRTRALDRYLLWHHFAVPTYYDDTYRIAYWDVFGRPDRMPRYGLGFWANWWHDPSNARALRENRR